VKIYLIKVWEQDDPSKWMTTGPIEAADFMDAIAVSATGIPSGQKRVMATPEFLKESLGIPKLPWEEGFDPLDPMGFFKNR